MSKIQEKLKKLKREKNAVILAHNYQPAEVQEAADYVGDSFGLSQKAANLEAEVIVFCGVTFMAESAKILSPEKTVLIPEKLAGCPMADMADVESLKKLKEKYPEAAVVCYVNSSAEIKAESDICCTSSNAVEIVNSVEADKVIFLPDQNLANFVEQKTEKEIIKWDGYCPVHHQVKKQDVKRMKKKYPEALVAVHPECKTEVLKEADFVGSTAAILDYAKNTEAKEIIIGTELGLLDRLKKENKEKKFYLLSPHLICKNMKKNSLKKTYSSLKKMETIIEIDEKTRLKAASALEKMLA